MAVTQMTTTWQRQKTGLHDEQGLEICEGDILKELVQHYYDRGTEDEMLSESVHVVSVVFLKGQFGILKYRWTEGGYEKRSPEGMFFKDLDGWLQSSGRYCGEGGHGYRVIGNVYDNPTIIRDYVAKTVIHRDVFTNSRKGSGEHATIKFVQMKDEFDPAKNCGLCGAPLDAIGVQQLAELLRQFIKHMDPRDHGNVTPTQRYEALVPIAEAASRFLTTGW